MNSLKSTSISLITLDIKFFDSVFSHGIIYKALKKKFLKVNFWNPRDFINKRNKNMDGKIYGGGPGVILKNKPLCAVICKVKNFYKNNCVLIYLSPEGKILNNDIIQNLLFKNIIFICGRYSGIDQRIIDKYVDFELSIGNYIISCGEIASIVVIDAIARNIPGVLNNQESIYYDSFCNSGGLLGFSNYTQPISLFNVKVPKILLSGNHKEIYLWRLRNSFKKTLLKKFCLLKKMFLNKKREFFLLIDKILNL